MVMGMSACESGLVEWRLGRHGLRVDGNYMCHEYSDKVNSNRIQDTA